MCHLRFLSVFSRGWLNMWRANRPSSIDYMESRDVKKKLKKTSLTITETCSNFIEKCSSRRANHRSSFMRNGYISLIYWSPLREFLTSLCIMWKVWISHEFCWWNMVISDLTSQSQFSLSIFYHQTLSMLIPWCFLCIYSGTEEYAQKSASS